MGPAGISEQKNKVSTSNSSKSNDQIVLSRLKNPSTSHQRNRFHWVKHGDMGQGVILNHFTLLSKFFNNLINFDGVPIGHLFRDYNIQL